MLTCVQSRSLVLEDQEQTSPPSNNQKNATEGQASDSRHMDVVYYSDTGVGVRPEVCKVDIIHGCEAAIQSMSASTRTTLVLCADSGPLSSLPHISGSCLFTFAKHSFAMTGSLAMFPAIKKEMRDLIDPRLYPSIQQDTDGKYFGALYVTKLSKCYGWDELFKDIDFDAIWDSLEETVGAIVKLQQKANGGKCPTNRLNIVVTNEEQLTAVRFCNNESEQPPELYYSEVVEAEDEEQRENRGRDGGLKRTIVIATKQMVGGPTKWNRVEKNQAAWVSPHNPVSFEDKYCLQEWFSSPSPSSL